MAENDIGWNEQVKQNKNGRLERFDVLFIVVVAAVAVAIFFFTFSVSFRDGVL